MAKHDHTGVHHPATITMTASEEARHTEWHDQGWDHRHTDPNPYVDSNRIGGGFSDLPEGEYAPPADPPVEASRP